MREYNSKRFGGNNPNSVVDSLFDLNGSVSDSQTKYYIDDHRNLLIDYRLLSQPPKKYKRNYLAKPFKERLVGTLNRMEIEGGHSPEVLETIVNLIKEDA